MCRRYRVKYVVVAYSVVVSHIKRNLDELVDLDIVVYTTSPVLLATALIKSVLIRICEHCTAADHLVTISNRNAMLVLWSPLLDHESIPISDRICIRIKSVVCYVIVNEILLILEVVTSLWVTCIIPLTLVLELHETLSAYHLRVLSTSCNSECTLVIYRDVTILSTFCSNEDNTGRSTCTIDRS